MWERGDIRKAAKSKEVRQQVSDYEDTQMVRAIADYAEERGRVQYSPREIGKISAEEFTAADGIASLQYCYELYRTRNTSENGRYVPLLGHLPARFLQSVDVNDYPVIMQVKKAVQAVAPESFKINDSHGHNIAPTDIVNMLSMLDENTYVAVNADNRYGLVDEMDDGRALILLADIEENKPASMVYGFGNGRYNVVVTAYARNSYDDAVSYLERKGYFEIQKKDVESSESSGERPLSYAIASEDSIAQNGEMRNSNTQKSLRTPVTDSPAFREWFAGSKVVNEDGSPKLMYHGTNANDNFTVFDTYGSNFGLYGIGSYFTDDRSVAEGYTKKGRGKRRTGQKDHAAVQAAEEMRRHVITPCNRWITRRCFYLPLLGTKPSKICRS